MLHRSENSLRLSPMLCLVAASLLVPAGLVGQGLGIGAHAGTNGFGVDVGLGSSRVVLRAGASIVPESYFLTDLIPSDISGVAYEVALPERTMRAGLDLHILGPLKLTGGVMHRSDDLVARATVVQTIDLGGTTFTQSGSVEARLEQSPLVPYVGIGLGNLSSGFGLYLDIGVSYSSESTVVMSALGDLASAPGINEALQREADQFLADAPDLMTQLYPTVQIGLKFGL